MKTVGTMPQSIEEKQFRNLETENAEQITKGLLQAGIPFLAKYDEERMLLAYSKKDENKVGEILAKGVYGYDEALLLFQSEPNNRYYAQLLLPEIADVLGVSISQLESKPVDIQILLARTYVSYWHSDNASIRKVLQQDIFVNHKEEKETEREKHINHEMERTR